MTDAGYLWFDDDSGWISIEDRGQLWFVRKRRLMVTKVVKIGRMRLANERELERAYESYYRYNAMVNTKTAIDCDGLVLCIGDIVILKKSTKSDHFNAARVSELNPFQITSICGKYTFSGLKSRHFRCVGTLQRY